MTINEHILIVDDDEVFVHILSRAIKNSGYHVSNALSHDAAIKTAKSDIPDKAIIDLKIGPDSGLQLITELKNISQQIDIIILTGYSSIATAVEAVKLGAINYLCKPCDADEILAAFNTNKTEENISLAAENPPSINRLEWEHIQKVLKENDGNISATARSLGMHRRTLQRKLQKKPVKH